VNELSDLTNKVGLQYLTQAVPHPRVEMVGLSPSGISAQYDPSLTAQVNVDAAVKTHTAFQLRAKFQLPNVNMFVRSVLLKLDPRDQRNSRNPANVRNLPAKY